MQHLTTYQLRKQKMKTMYLKLHVIKLKRRDYTLEKISEEFFLSVARVKRILPLAECEIMEKEYLENIKKPE